MNYRQEINVTSCVESHPKINVHIIQYSSPITSLIQKSLKLDIQDSTPVNPLTPQPTVKNLSTYKLLLTVREIRPL